MVAWSNPITANSVSIVLKTIAVINDNMSVRRVGWLQWLTRRCFCWANQPSYVRKWEWSSILFVMHEKWNCFRIISIGAHWNSYQLSLGGYLYAIYTLRDWLIMAKQHMLHAVHGHRGFYTHIDFDLIHRWHISLSDRFLRKWLYVYFTQPIDYINWKCIVSPNIRNDIKFYSQKPQLALTSP